MERTDLDDAIISLAYYYIAGASYLMDTLHKEAKVLCLEREISPEQKAALKRDLAFTSKTIAALGEAQRSYRSMMRAIDIVETDLNKRLVKSTCYDEVNAHMMSLVSFSLPWLMLANEDRQNEQQILDYMKTFHWSEDLTKAFSELRRNVAYYRALKK